MQEFELTILIPCLNEAETIAACIKKAMAFLESNQISGEVLVADNGSIDGSQALADQLGARLVAVPKRGYGAALLGGIAAARGEYTIMGDADDSYDFSRLEAFVEKLRAGYDLVMGNRFQGGIEPGAMPMLHRYLGNPVLSMLGRVFFGIPISDFHCGLRGFRTASMRDLGLMSAGMEFASEMVVRSWLEGLKITEVPTTLRPDGRSRAPHLKTWRDGWRHLKFLLMYSPRWLFIFPGAMLMCLGVLLAVALWTGPLQLTAGLELDLNSFVAACFLVITGFQTLSMGVFARYYASLTGMLPRGRHSERVIKTLSTDRIVIAAGGILLLGLVLFGYAVVQWLQVGLGDLTNPHVRRVVVAGLSLMVIGIQLGFGAFMLGILEIPLIQSRSEGAELAMNALDSVKPKE
jgi:glycosyltransferase involved in cell wall biosynthesis